MQQVWTQTNQNSTLTILPKYLLAHQVLESIIAEKLFN